MSEAEDTPREGRDPEASPRSPLDAEIQLLLDRLSALQTREVDQDEEPIRDVAVDAIRARLRELSRKCTDQTCSIRTIEEVRKAVEPEREEEGRSPDEAGGQG
jgi:hypothetical protein